MLVIRTAASAKMWWSAGTLSKNRGTVGWRVRTTNGTFSAGFPRSEWLARPAKRETLLVCYVRTSHSAVITVLSRLRHVSLSVEPRRIAGVARDRTFLK